MSREAPAAALARGHRIRPNSNYGRITSIALDPVEKKPLVLWHPGSYVLSVGSYGCNPRCPFCQNWEISQAGPDDVPWRKVSPEQLVALASDTRERDQDATRQRQFCAGAF